ncbi:hypothetical protein AVEN_252085-1 [Araneus ventricosus]|uniref:Uncharacterized protein n=1 Tax=Araneus ventricosus TaxID=182803 RepID=A0A4Y2TLG9_ARAVE|nr:hypothetical protein AVEN_252085-1 [Araneus ventricosus]
MVWVGICASGKTPLVFVDGGVKINHKVYRRDILEAVVIPWAEKHFDVSTRLRKSSQGQKDTRGVQGIFSGHDIICRMATLLARSQSHGLQCMVHFGV